MEGTRTEFGRVLRYGLVVVDCGLKRVLGQTLVEYTGLTVRYVWIYLETLAESVGLENQIPICLGPLASMFMATRAPESPVLTWGSGGPLAVCGGPPMPPAVLFSTFMMESGGKSQTMECTARYYSDRVHESPIPRLRLVTAVSGVPTKYQGKG
jgi:hypothetical protein